MADSASVAASEAKQSGAALDPGSVQFSRPAHLSDFTRIAWVGDDARAVWGDRISRIVAAWADAERRSVCERLRPCALLSVEPNEMVDISAWCVRNGIAMIPLAQQASGGALYSTVARPAESGEQFNYRVAIGGLDELREFERAWSAQNDSAMGALLGFPECCRDFFDRVWKARGLTDTTWEMAVGTSNGNIVSPCCLQVAGPAECNILLRWIGVRAVPHLPCAFDCRATAEFGHNLLAFMDTDGKVEESSWIREILDWPAEWSARHGIAEIKTPIFKISARTDVAPIRLVVRREGASYPELGASGNRFPYRKLKAGQRLAPSSLPLTQSAAAEELSYRANGFVSACAMQDAHRPIVELARDLLLQTVGAKRLLDLGCGDGELLRKIRNAVGDVFVCGIDLDPVKIRSAQSKLPAGTCQFWAGDFFSPDAEWPSMKFSAVLLMPGRLLERPESDKAALRQRLTLATEKILVYAYQDTLSQSAGNLKDLSEGVGLRLLAQPHDGRVALAEFC